MSEEVSQSKISSAASYLLFPALTSTGEIISIAKRNNGFGANSKVAQEMETFKKFVQNAKNPNDVQDIFSKGMSLSENYEAYKNAANAASKAQKTLDKGVNVSFIDKYILNPIRKRMGKEIVTEKSIKAQKQSVVDNFNSLKNNLENGVNIVSQTAQKANASTISKIGNNFKKEATNPLVLFFTALQAIPEIKEKVIPAFKEKGFVAGIKQTGLSLFKIGTNFISYVSGSVLGKVVGQALGVLIFPHAAAAAAILGQVGSTLAMTLTGVISDKVVKKVEDKAAKKEAEKQALNTEA